MPTSPPAPSQRRASGRRVFLPTLLLGVVVVAWSGFWWYASTRVQSEWSRFVVRQAELGRQIRCADQSFGGYPFRLEVRCTNPQVTSTRPGQSFDVHLADLGAVAQVYQPNKVILEAKGPLTVVDGEGEGATVTANWASAEASMGIWTSGPSNADIVIKGLDANATRAGQATSLVAGANVEAHIRLAVGANAAPGAYDVVAKADAGSMPPLDRMLGGPEPLSGEFQATVTQIDLQPRPMRERLRAWAADGGSLQIVLAQLNRGPSSVKAAGTVALDDGGHPAGDLTVALAGINEMSGSLQQAGLASGRLVGLMGVGLSMLGKPTNIDGKTAVEVPVRLANGKVSIGSFPAGRLPSLF
ncbi:DUF2125 domain-containing protein [Labrys monachus]|uniref:DUF2125 domain-containing protein n=1 Tax=Labrys monachus TaxID=217067 RepID=A0ABU0FPL9_9HYPH|nr:DUF2125 domain-containing protein [Labrys monachus]MDQ0396486.1 hypothetical protein [Labrys monachus]